MIEAKKREWHSDRRSFGDHPKPCGHTRDTWICSQCADKQIRFAEAECDRLRAVIAGMAAAAEANRLLQAMHEADQRPLVRRREKKRGLRP